MIELVSSSEDECVFTGAKTGGLPRPVRETLSSASRSMAGPLEDDIAGLPLDEEVAQVVICNEAAIGEPRPLHCGSPAAAAKRRALRNQERLRTQHPGAHLTQESHRPAEISGASATEKDKRQFFFDENDVVLDVRCLNETCGGGRMGQTQGEATDVEDSGIALWGGSLEGQPDWLPLPGKQVNAKGERVEWLRHARYGVGTYIDTERLVSTHIILCIPFLMC
ncbi:hypothetical protein Emag_006641 [Eimeria magna]